MKKKRKKRKQSNGGETLNFLSKAFQLTGAIFMILGCGDFFEDFDVGFLF